MMHFQPLEYATTAEFLVRQASGWLQASFLVLLDWLPSRAASRQVMKIPKGVK